MLKKGFILSGVLALTFSALVGCGQTAEKPGDSNQQLTGSLTAVGSTAMQPVVEELASDYMSKNSGVQISIQGGGSGQGLAAAVDDTADLGNSDVFAEEKDKVDPSKIKDHKVFVVGMGPVANPNVGVDNLTQKQLVDIFTGKVTNWKQVGGKDQKIVLVNRSESSGTRAVFVKWALNGAKEYRAQGGIEQDSSGTVKKIISETPGAIGYLAFSYFDNKVKALKLDGVDPTNANVYNNTWKVWAYEHMYTNVNGKNNKLEDSFIQYILKPETQTGIVTKLGYIPITKMTVERDAAGTITQK